MARQEDSDAPSLPDQADEKITQGGDGFRALLEAIPDAVVVYDPQGRATYVNQAFEETFGWTPEEVMGHSLDFFVPQGEADRTRQGWERTLAGERLFFETKRITKDGRLLDIQLRSAILTDQEGRHTASLVIHRDVTERKRAEEALRDSEEKYRTLVERSLQGLIIAQGLPPRIVFVNQALADTLGYTIEELRALSFYEMRRLVHPDDQGLFFQRYQERLMGEEPPDRYEIRGLRKDGSTVWAELFANRIQYLGQPAVQTVFVDITQRKQAEEALRASEERYRSVMEAAPDAIVVRDTKGKATYVNPAFTRVFGWNLEEMQDAKLVFVPEAAWPETREHVAKLVRGEGFYGFETTRYTKAGNIIHISMSADVFKDSHGNPLGSVIIFQDITERKQAEEALRASEERYRSVMEAAPDAIVIYDMEGRTTYVNPAFTRVFGWSLEDLQGKQVDYVPEEAWPETEKHIAKIMRGEGFYGFETIRYTKNGDVIHIRMSAEVFRNQQGNPLGSVIILQDITAGKRAEEAIERERRRFRTLAEKSPLGISLLSQDGSFEYVNPQFIEMFGYTLEDVPAGRQWFQRAFPDPDLRRQAIATWKSDLKEIVVGITPPRTFEVVCKDQTRKTILMRPVVLPDKNFLVIYEDITERKRAEEALGESQRRMAQIIDFLPDATWVIDREGRVVAWNRAMESLSGVKAQDMLGLGDYEHAVPLYGERRPCLIDLVGRPELSPPEGYLHLERQGNCMFSESFHPALKPGGVHLWGAACVLFDAEGERVGAIETLRDVTERKRAEEALRESERSLAQIIDFLPDATWVIDHEGRVVAWNQAMEALSGVKAEDILGLGDYEYTIPFYGERRPCLIDLLNRPDPEYERTYANLTREGDRLVGEAYCPHLRPGGAYMSGVASPLYDAQGNRVGAIESLRDITDQKRAEEALRLDEARLEALVKLGQMHGSPLQKIIDTALEEGVRLTGSAIGYVGFLNEDETVMTIMGRSSGAMKECAVPNKPVSYRIAEVGLWGEAVRQRRPVITNDYPTAPHKKGYPPGHIPILRHMNVPVMDGERIVAVAGVGNKGEPYDESDVRQLTLLMGAMWKIVQHRRDEEAIRESQERNRGLLEALPDPVVVYDPQGNAKYLNQAFTATYGWTMEELLGRPIDFVPPEEAEKTRNSWERVLGGEKFLLETKRLTKDGRELDIQSTFTILRDRAGMHTDSIVIHRDITELRRLETRIQQAHRLQSLGAVAGGVAHDFNNILMGVLGHVDLAMAKLSPDAAVHVHLTSIQEAVDKAAKLTKHMLDFSGKGHWTVEPVSLTAVVEEMSSFLRTALPKTATLQFRLASDLPAIEADAGQLKQVIMNLAANACEALEGGEGVITVATGARQCDREYLKDAYLPEDLAEARYVYLQVADTGCGIDPKVRGKIFEPFFSTKFTGRGLGLAATLGIVRGHKGTIKVDSELGKGTTFTVLFPASSAGVQSAAAGPRAAKGHPAAGLVLVADDEEQVREVVSQALEAHGFTVLTATDGQEAVEVFRRQADRIGLVLLDLTMPRMGGQEAFREIRKIKQDVPVILSSGYSEQEATEQLKDSGLAGFLPKPYRLQQLIDLVGERLQVPSPAGGGR